MSKVPPQPALRQEGHLPCDQECIKSLFTLFITSINIGQVAVVHARGLLPVVEERGLHLARPKLRYFDVNLFGQKKADVGRDLLRQLHQASAVDGHLVNIVHAKLLVLGPAPALARTPWRRQKDLVRLQLRSQLHIVAEDKLNLVVDIVNAGIVARVREPYGVNVDGNYFLGGFGKLYRVAADSAKSVYYRVAVRRLHPLCNVLRHLFWRHRVPALCINHPIPWSILIPWSNLLKREYRFR